MIALITGASSGLGHDMALYLSSLGYDLILVARRKERLEQLAQAVSTNAQIIALDLALEENCYTLYEQVKNQNIDILINDAGYGLFGAFSQTPIKEDAGMIDINIKALHLLMKLFLNDMRARNAGYILNVASSAAFAPGPMMATYYASKAFVLRLSEAVYQELKEEHSKVVISTLCPGPVKTEFNKTASVSFKMKGMSSVEVSKYAIDSMFKKKLVIIPGFTMKMAKILATILPNKWILKVVYRFSTAFTE
ncbi:MAG: SDR family NAD(P)-dependent oxidoreductase [Bacteroidales bacterium]